MKFVTDRRVVGNASRWRVMEVIIADDDEARAFCEAFVGQHFRCVAQVVGSRVRRTRTRSATIAHEELFVRVPSLGDCPVLGRTLGIGPQHFALPSDRPSQTVVQVSIWADEQAGQGWFVSVKEPGNGYNLRGAEDWAATLEALSE